MSGKITFPARFVWLVPCAQYTFLEWISTCHLSINTVGCGSRSTFCRAPLTLTHCGCHSTIFSEENTLWELCIAGVGFILRELGRKLEGDPKKHSLAICAPLEATGWSTGLNISQKMNIFTGQEKSPCATPCRTFHTKTDFLSSVKENKEDFFPVEVVLHPGDDNYNHGLCQANNQQHAVRGGNLAWNQFNNCRFE